jgi:glycosyltransferase involved in cell wall biosynthesis
MSLEGKPRGVVLAISPFLWPLGEDQGVRAVFETLNGYREAGYQVHLVTLAKGAEQVTAHRGLHLHGFHLPLVPPGVDYGPLRSLFSYPLGIMRFPGLAYVADKLLWAQFLLAGTRKALRVAREVKPDLIYGVTCYGVPVAWAVARHMHLPNLSRMLGTFLYPRLLPASSPLRWLKLRLRLLLSFPEVLAFKLPARLLIISNDGTRGAWVAERLGVPARQVRCWIDGLVPYLAPSASVEETRARFGFKPEDKVVLAVCQLVLWKRVDRLIDAFALALKQVPEARLLVIGDGRERAALERHAAARTPAGALVFAGAVAHSEVMDCLAATDVYASAHDLTNACNTLFEAMRAGCPIVTIRNGDTDSFIENAVNGVLVDDTSPASFAAALVPVLQQPELRRKLGEGARQSAQRLLPSWHDRMQREVREVEAQCLLPVVPQPVSESAVTPVSGKES